MKNCGEDIIPKEQRRIQSEKMKVYWNDREASDAHRQTVSHDAIIEPAE